MNPLFIQAQTMTNPKVLLLNPPNKSRVIRDNYCSFTSKSNYLWPPIDLLILSGILNSHCRLTIIDAVAEKISIKKTLTKINQILPDFIISLTGTASFSSDKLFFHSLNQQNKKWHLILLGNIAAFNPKTIFKNIPQTKAILHNFTSPEIIDYINHSKKVFQHISTKSKNSISFGTINSQKHFVSYPTPKHDLFPLNYYQTPIALASPLTSVITTFGCPFSCKFCVASSLKFTQRPLKNVLQELHYIKKLNIKEIFFQDSTFNTNKTFVIKLCKSMIKLKYNFSWSANVHSFNFDNQIAYWMKKAGCHTLQVGIENASDAILSKYQKYTSINKIKSFFNIANKHHFNTLGYFIFGLPGETKKSMLDTTQLAIDLDPTYASFSIATADFGTKLHQALQKKKQIVNQSKDFDSSKITNIYLSKNFSTLTNSQIKNAYLKFYFRPNKIYQLTKIAIKNKTIHTFLNQSFNALKNFT